MSEPKRLAEIIGGAVGRALESEQARAYRAWTRAVGVQIAAVTHPLRFARGTLTVACESSVWANELTYLTNTILARMDEVEPGHPVRRLRFHFDAARPDNFDLPAR